MLCNLLTTILRPNFDEPLDTAKQLVEKNIILFDVPGGDMWKQFMLESPNPEYNKLGMTYIVADDWYHFDNMSLHGVIGNGTHTYMGGTLNWWYFSMGRWYRSKEKVDGKFPYGGYLTNKKWHLNEVISLKQFVHAILLIQF